MIFSPVTQTFFSFTVSPQSLSVQRIENAPARLLTWWQTEALCQPRNKFNPIALMLNSPPPLPPNRASWSAANPSASRLPPVPAPP